MTATSTHRKTIAVLVDYMNLFAGGYETEFRRLFERLCASLDINLMFVYGRALAHPSPGSAAHNRIYDLLGPRRLDGLISLSSSITSYCGVEGARVFFERYRSLAVCSAGLAVPSVPSIEVDNRPGMDALLDHLIVHHGYRTIAFITGPAANVEAQSRFAAYRAALDRHGIPFRPELVEPGSFSRRDGERAARSLLARIGKPEALVAANDSTALGAITAFHAAGLRIPRDLAVTGFDDLVIARLGDPPLTTVCQPIAAMVELAVNLVLQQLNGETVPERSQLTTSFIARESCGCRPGTGHARAAEVLNANGAHREQLARRAAELRSAAPSRSWGSRDASGDTGRLLMALETEFSDRPGKFLAELENILSEVGDSNDRYQTLQSLITELRAECIDLVHPALEDLWHDARSLISLTNSRKQEQLRLDQDQTYHRLIDNGERFATALDLATLKPALANALCTLGVGHAYVSQYTDQSERELECFVAIRDGAPFQPATPRFPADELLPKGTLPAERRSTFLVFPLAFDEQSLGVAVFEARAGMGGYTVVRDQISAALRSIALHEEIIRQTTLHERRVQEQERQATAKRIQSLSVLAGGVAHDLNNVLGPLVALPDLITEQLDQKGQDHSSSVDLRADIETIKVAALRAAQTIKDLLTLGRQGRTAKEPLSLNDAVSRCMAADALPLLRNAHVSIELSAEPLFVLGSEAHLGRAVTNLVRNAVEAIDVQGKVCVRTAPALVREPIAGYETIDPGEYAAIIVSDDGCGIPAQEVCRIFEPFFSSKRLSDHCGSGLGLAIVHGVVKEHGGFVNVESAVGEGTTFTLYLPRIARAEPHPTVLGDAPRGSARVLVVDDEPVQLRTCRRVLSHLGYQVDALSSGREAYQLFLRARSAKVPSEAEQAPIQSPYDLVILDMLLNEEDDGVVLLKKIQALFPGQRAIIASGHAPSERVELALSSGIRWLAKPYTRAALAHAVSAALPASLSDVATSRSHVESMRSDRAPSRAPRSRTNSRPPRDPQEP